jgi:hypothetical protein
MDTLQFREQAVQAAEALKILKTNADGTYTLIGEGMKGTFTMAELFSSDALSRQQWFTSEVMMDTFKKYSAAVDQVYAYADANDITATQAIEQLQKSGQVIDEFGLKAFRAAQEARTFRDVMDATADAVGTAWMKVWETIVGDYEESRTVFTQMAEDLYDIFAQPVNDLQETLFSGLASGWKRMAKDSGISTKKMKEQLTTYAEASGVALDDLIKEYGSFEASLKGGWVTNEMLAASFQDLEDRLSTLSEDELLKEGFTTKQLEDLRKLNEEFRSGKRDISEWVKSLSAVSGRENLIQAVWNLRDALFAFDEENDRAIGVIAIFKEAWGEVFPSLEGDTIYAITERIREFTQSLIPSEERAEKLRRTFKGVASVFDIVRQSAKGVWDTLKNAFSALSGARIDLLGFTGTIGDAISEFAESGKIGEFFGSISERLTSALKKLSPILEAVRKAADKVLKGSWNLIKRAWPVVTGFFGDVWDGLGQITDGFVNAFRTVTGMSFSEVIDTIGQAIETAWEATRNFVDAWAEANGINLGAGIAKVFGWIAEAAGKVGEIVGNLWNTVYGFFSGVSTEKLTGGWQSVADFFTGLWNSITSSGIWTSLEGLWPSVESIFTTIFDAVGGWLTDLAEQLKAMDLEEVKVHLSEIISMLTTGGLSGGLLYALFKGLNKKDISMEDALVQLVTNIGIAISKLGGVFSSLSKSIKANVLLKLALAIGIIAASIGYLVNALKDASPAEALGAVAIVVVMITMMVKAMELINAAEGTVKGSGKVLFGMAAAIGILVLCLSAVLKMVQTANDGEIWEAVGIIATLGLVVVGMITLLSLVQKKLGKAQTGAFIGIAFAIGMLVTSLAAITALVHMAPDGEIWEAVGIIATLGLVVVGMITLLGLVQKKLGKAQTGAFIGISFAIGMLVTSLVAVTMLVHIAHDGEIWEAVGIITVLGAVVVGMIALLALIQNKLGNAAAAAASVLILSVAIAILAGALIALTQLGNMDNMATAVVALIAMTALLAGAIYVLAGVGPQALLAATAMVIFSVAVGILAAAIILASTVPVETLSNVAKVLMGSVVVMVAAGALAESVAPGLLVLSAALLALGLTAVLIGAGLLLVGVALPLVAGGLKLLSDALPEEASNRLDKAAWPLTKLGGALAAFAVAAAPATVELLALAPLLAQFVSALMNLADLSTNNFFGDLQYSMTLFSTGIADSLSKMESAVNSGADSVVAAGKRMSSEGPAALREGIPLWEQAGADFVAGLVRGIDSWMSVAVAEAATLGSRMLLSLRASLDEQSPSRETNTIGKFFVLGLKEGIDQNDSLAIASARQLGNGALDTMSGTIMKLAEYMDESREFDPVIRPVLDLSNVAEGASQIGGYFSATQAVGIAARMNSANAVNTAYGDDSGSTAGPTYSFVQNNYSPKALNRLEIYRQTRNQISAIEGVRAV